METGPSKPKYLANPGIVKISRTLRWFRYGPAASGSFSRAARGSDQ
jgi:hypothetical protein